MSRLERKVSKQRGEIKRLKHSKSHLRTQLEETRAKLGELIEMANRTAAAHQHLLRVIAAAAYERPDRTLSISMVTYASIPDDAQVMTPHEDLTRMSFVYVPSVKTTGDEDE